MVLTIVPSPIAGYKGDMNMNKEFAWFLGTLLSDGSITRPSYDNDFIQYCIHINDKAVLEKIKTIVDTRARILEYPNYKSPQAKLCIYDKDWIIKKYNTIKSEIPDDITSDNYRHFIRGIVDGDGCLNYRHNRNTFRINIINEVLDIVEWCSEVISDTLGISYKTPKFKPQDNIYIIEWEGRTAQLVAWWLYHGDIDSCVLDRKLLYYRRYVLDGLDIDGEEEMLYAIGATKDGNRIYPNVNASITLKWCHIIQGLLYNKYLTLPVHHSKGKTKYYFLYVPHMDC